MSRELHHKSSEWYACQYPERDLVREHGAIDTHCPRCLIALDAVVARNAKTLVTWRVDGGAEPMTAADAAQRLLDRAAS